MADSDIKQFALRLPKDMVAQIDERADKLDISRNQWFENMVEWVLKHTFTTDASVALAKEAKKRGVPKD